MNHVMAILALATLGIFLGILIWHVPSPDLITVVTIVYAMAAFDFLRTLFARK